MLEVVPFIYNNDPDELLANTYIVIDSDKQCIVVDPSKNNENIKNYILKNGLTLKAVCLTHGHFDHFSGAKILLDAFKVDLFVSILDEFMLKDPEYNCSIYISGPNSLDVKCTNYPEIGVLSLLNEDIVVIPTPYHTEGSVCLYLKDSGILLSGDFLFRGGLGRCDLPNNAARKKNQSLEKVFALPKETKVYPGHGPITSIALEKNYY